MTLKPKTHKRKPKVHVIAEEVKPEQIPEIIPHVQVEEIEPEPHVNVLVPKSTWQQIKDWLGGD